MSEQTDARQRLREKTPVSEQTSSDDLTAIPVERIVRDVRRCVEENISVAGLALALTIPDILGAQCFPDMTYRDGDRRIGAQYERWFDKYVAREFVDRAHWLTGETCYDLRCEMLHAGDGNIRYHHHEDRGVKYRYSFELVDDGEQSHTERALDGGRVRECRVRLNADMLASAICDGAERCLAETGESESA